ncbi:MAG: thiamine pyrophosphate-dependent enzyme [Anaerovoracaceae bacterium]|jgi:2-oxoglutarate ferredoxin oxidoreductase subunit beta
MYKDFLLEEKLPLFWCAGCGDGIVLRAILEDFSNKGWTRENTVVVTGIGCWGKADDYITTNTFHGTHGRALAFATGMKLAKPSLNVVVLMGDGDGVTIGGNHLIHAARRNVDITGIMVNNFNYGMTGGQYSGTTPKESLTKTSPYGHVENPFDVSELVKAAGATFVARATVYDVNGLGSMISKATAHRGFSFVEVISPCPTHFGRNNKLGNAPEMMKYIRDNTVDISKASGMTADELRGKIVTGISVDREAEDYSSAYRRITENMKGDEH